MNRVYANACLWLCSLLSITSLYAQSAKLDSIYSLLNNHPDEDTVRVNLILSACYYEYTSNPDKNRSLAEEAIAISRKLNYTDGVGYAIRYIALYHWVKGSYDKAAAQGYDMVRIFEHNGNTQGLAKAYGLLGLVHEEMRNFEKAEGYHLKALEINTSASRKYDMAYNLNSLGALHHRLSHYDTAAYYYTRSLDLRKEIKDDDGASQSYSNLAHINKIRKNYPDAITYFKQALATATKVGNKNRIAIVLMGLGEVSILTGNYNDAAPYLEEALLIAKELGSKKRLRETYRKLALMEDRRKNYKTALEYLDLEFKYNDSIFNEEKSKQIAELEARYETEKKEQTIQLLERDRKIDRLWRYLLSGILVILLVGAIIAFRWQRYRSRKNFELLNLRIDVLTAREKELMDKYQEAITVRVGESYSSRDQQLLKRVIDLVEKHLSDPGFGVEQMAEEMNMSRASLHRRLKSMTSISPSDLIRSIRLKRAAQMLLGNTDNVAQIGYSVGFEDHSYFTKSFKKHFGVAPSDYARNVPEPENHLAG